jgi:hypothetical protein
LGSDDTSLAKGRLQQLEVGLLEEALSGSLGVRAVSDDNIELVLAVLEELEAVTNVGVGVGVLEANGHAGQVLLGNTDDSLIDVAQSSLLDRGVLDDLTEDTAVTATNDKDLLGVGVGVHGEVGDHLLVGELIALSALDNVVQHKNGTVVAALEDEDILVLGLLVVNDLVDLEAHGLTGPHARLLREPAICRLRISICSKWTGRRGNGGGSHIPWMVGWVSSLILMKEEKRRGKMDDE